MYINPYTGEKYKTIENAKTAKIGKNFPSNLTRKKFLEILKKFEVNEK